MASRAVQLPWLVPNCNWRLHVALVVALSLLGGCSGQVNVGGGGFSINPVGIDTEFHNTWWFWLLVAIIASWFLVATVFVWRGFRNYKRYKAALEEYRRRDKFANATLKRLATRAAERGEGDAAAYGKGAVGDNSEAGGPGDLELGPVSDWAELLGCKAGLLYSQEEFEEEVARRTGRKRPALKKLPSATF